MVKKAGMMEIVKMIEKRDGIVSPIALVDEARPIDSPIHDAFEWDDSQAAEKYRIWQARDHIRTIQIEWKGKRVGGYHNVVVEIDKIPTRGYVSTEVVSKNEDLRNQVLRDAAREITTWQNKYREVSELEGVVDTEKLEKVIASI